MKSKIDNGLIQIYTGNGKGKTSAALGLALRASGHDFKVVLIQFIKGTPCGEHRFITKYNPFKIIKLNGDNNFKKPKEDLKKEAREILEIAAKCLTDSEYDIVILDEIFMAYNMSLININDIMHLMDIKPASVELIMTGRMAPPKAIERADLVTNMTMVKHPYYKGVNSRMGIEY
jgi:cob(I)alamin adenosyltransferase